MTDASGYPIWFENGVPQGLDGNIGTRSSGKDGQEVAHLAPSEVDSDMANAYTKSEIMGFLKHQAETGSLRRKVDQFQNKKQIK